LTSTIEEGGWLTTASLSLGITPIPLYRRLGEPQVVPGLVWNILPTMGFDPQTVQSVTSSYNVNAIPLTRHLYIKIIKSQILRYFSM